MFAYKAYFSGKKITVMGLGLLGRGVGDVEFLAQCGAKLTVTDLKKKSELAISLKKLKKYRGITYVFGKHRLSDFRDKDMVLKAAGVPLDSPYIAEAKKNGIPVEMDASLFARLAYGVTIIGVTGTRGKSTTTNLIYQILKRADKRAHLAGNIQGIATLPLFAKVRPDDYVVAELDSWQLQGFGDAKISPHISVFTNFMRDHQNYYKGSMQKYFSDKANIYTYQKKEDYIICGKEVASKIKSKSKKIIAKWNNIPKNWKIKLLGKHNKENIACAINVAEALGIRAEVIRKEVENFNGVPGRLEFVRTWKGITFYNDTTSTTPDALIAALETLGRKKKNIILIAGGTDKNLEYGSATQSIKKYVKTLVFFPGTATEKMKKLLPKGFVYEEVKNMKEGLKQAIAYSTKGDVILLSPGAASFGLFKNEYDRGEQFNREIGMLN